MAKIFYTLEEAAQKLGKSQDEVRQLVANGQLQEFRDRDRLMFKRDQVDVLAGDDSISLTDDLEPISLASSGSGSGLSLADDTKEGTGAGGSGISIFDVTDEADPNSKTVMAAGATAPDFSIDPSTSGSGLLNLTREADDTGLGEDLISDVYGQSEQPVGNGVGELFETTSAVADVAPSSPGATLIAVAPIDGGWSGFAGGAALGMTLSMLAVLGLLIMALTGIGAGAGAAGGTGDMLELVSKNLMPVVGGMAGAILIFGVIGMLIGKKTA
ncbi:MAG: helix-turn-helix domain-containing protein [Phycisphaeraceae bacterium]|nr:helix-turn-helix domain-containing protein [Phycisphaeraceae bacterium]MCW5755023.1 helix-turn-helix domain-containing protein [Phycisphaeraceae bacterium]